MQTIVLPSRSGAVVRDTLFWMFFVFILYFLYGLRKTFTLPSEATARIH